MFYIFIFIQFNTYVCVCLNFPQDFLFDPWVIRSVLFTFQLFGNSLVLFMFWFLAWIHSGWRTYSELFQFFSICWGLWVVQHVIYMFHGHSKRMWILLLGGVSYKCWLDPTDWCCCLLYTIADFLSSCSCQLLREGSWRLQLWLWIWFWALLIFLKFSVNSAF